MEKIRLKARMGRGALRIGNYIVLLTRNNIWIRSFSGDSFTRKFPKLAKKIKAANGKCIDIEITMKEVKKW